MNLVSTAQGCKKCKCVLNSTESVSKPHYFRQSGSKVTSGLNCAPPFSRAVSRAHVLPWGAGCFLMLSVHADFCQGTPLSGLLVPPIHMFVLLPLLPSGTCVILASYQGSKRFLKPSKVPAASMPSVAISFWVLTALLGFCLWGVKHGVLCHGIFQTSSGFTVSPEPFPQGEHSTSRGYKVVLFSPLTTPQYSLCL